MRGDRLEHGAEPVVGLRRAAGHDRGAVERALFPAGDARAHEVQPAGADVRLAAPSVVVVRIAAVHDDVPGVHQGGELLDHRVRRSARLDHDDRHARGGQGVDEIRHRLGRVELAFAAVLGRDLLGLADAAIVNGHFEAIACEIAGQIRAHHRHAGDADIRGSLGRGGDRHCFSFVGRCGVTAGAAPKPAVGCVRLCGGAANAPGMMPNSTLRPGDGGDRRPERERKPSGADRRRDDLLGLLLH